MRKIEKVAKYREISLKEALEERLRLLEESKREKWNERLDISRIPFRCPFCYEIISLDFDYLNSCKRCLCPPDICSDNGKKGYIETFLNKSFEYKQNLSGEEKYEFREKKLRENLPVMIGLFDKWIEITEKEIEER